MMDPRDGGRTSIAFSQAMAKGMAPPAAQPRAPAGPPPPSDFVASNVKIYVSEYDVQMVEFWSPATKQYLVLQQGFEFDPSAEAFNGNTFHVELNSQSFAIYGGVQAVRVQPGELTIFFDGEGQQRMRTTKVTIRFALDWKMYAYLLRKLHFTFKEKLQAAPVAMPQVVQAAGFTLDDTQTTKQINPNMRVHARTRLEPLKATGRFGNVVFATLESATIFEGTNPDEVALFEAARASLQDTLERDLTSVMAFDVTTTKSKRFYIYTSLSQGDFMERVNDALRTLPRLPLSFGGGTDAPWENYAGAMQDVS